MRHSFIRLDTAAVLFTMLGSAACSAPASGPSEPAGGSGGKAPADPEPAPTSTMPAPTSTGIIGQGGSFNVREPDGGTGEGCASSSFETNLLPTNILFVVDRSGSMKCLPETSATECEGNIPATALPGSKWEAIVGAIGASITELAAIPDTSAGIAFFSNDDACGVNSQPSVGVNPLTQPQIDALNASLAAVEPNGGTPIIGATILAYQHLHQEAQAPGNRFVVLVTDGKDSCLDGTVTYGVAFDPVAQLLDTEMPKAETVNIRTFVIGAPGSEEARSLLSQMAFSGNTARSDTCDHSGSAADVGDCHFDMTTSSDFAADFAAALNEITGRAALTCEFALPTGEDVDPNKVNVSFFRGGATEVELFRDDACSDATTGWQYADEEQTKISLCSDVCDELRSDAEGRVDIVLGCETRIVR